MSDVLPVSASLAVLDDGSVWAWGSNIDGQLGTGVGQDTDHESIRQMSMSGQLPGVNTSEGSSDRQEDATIHAARVCSARKWSGMPDFFR